MLRYRGKKLTEVVQKLDSFPKIPTDYQEYTGIGGICKFRISVIS